MLFNFEPLDILMLKSHGLATQWLCDIQQNDTKQNDILQRYK